MSVNKMNMNRTKHSVFHCLFLGGAEGKEGDGGDEGRIQREEGDVRGRRGVVRGKG